MDHTHFEVLQILNEFAENDILLLTFNDEIIFSKRSALSDEKIEKIISTAKIKLSQQNLNEQDTKLSLFSLQLTASRIEAGWEKYLLISGNKINTGDTFKIRFDDFNKPVFIFTEDKPVYVNNSGKKFIEKFNIDFGNTDTLNFLYDNFQKDDATGFDAFLSLSGNSIVVSVPGDQHNFFEILLIKEIGNDILIFNDITTEKNRLVDLIETEKKFEYICSNSILSMFIMQDGKIKFLNDNSNILEDRAKEELESRNNFDFLKYIHPEDRPFVKDQINKKLSGNPDARVSYIFRIVLDNGEIKHINIKSRFGIIDGKETLVGTLNDITDLRETNLALLEKERILQSISSALPVGIGWVKNRKFVWFNKKLNAMTGYSDSELEGKSTRKLYISENDFYAAGDRITNVIHSDDIDDLIVKWKRKDGRLIDVRLTFALIDQMDPSAGMIFSSTDITSELKAEKELLESEKKYRQLIEDSSDIIYRTDKNGRLSFINAVGEKKYGFSYENFIGKNPLDFVREDYQKRAGVFYLRQYLQKVRHTYIELPIIDGNGHERWIGQNVQLLFDGDVFKGFQAISREITKRKKAENELKLLNRDLEKRVENRTAMLDEALKDVRYENDKRKIAQNELMKTHIELKIQRERIADEAMKLVTLNDELSKSELKLKEANVSKDKFLSIIAHDLKNPLQGLLLSVELLVLHKDKYEVEQMHQKHEQILEQIKIVLDFLKNLLEWARAQSGRIEYDPDIYGMKEISEDCMNLIQNSADRKNIEIINKIDEDAIAYIDKDMINTCLRNILSNAIKFTPEGGSIELLSDDENEFAIIRIKDNGVGISRDNIEKLFKIDEQYSTPGTNSESGTGLGLLIVNEFINRNSGRIEVESKVGSGSEFILYLPRIILKKEGK